MQQTQHSPAPVRADLVNVTPVYYAIVESRKFGSVKAMCKQMSWRQDVVQPYCDNAALNCSDVVVIDCLRLGDPATNSCAVLCMKLGGAVVLCAGMFGEASDDRAVVARLAAEFAASQAFSGKFIGIGEFRPNPKAVLQ